MERLTNEQRKLVEDHLYMAKAAAGWWCRKNYHLRGHEQDLIQECVFGLMAAARTFTAGHESGAKFSTYAFLRVRQAARASDLVLGAVSAPRDENRSIRGVVHQLEIGDVRLPAENADPADHMDGSGLMPRLHARLGKPCEHKRPARADPSRNASIYVQYRFGDITMRELGAEHGVSWQRIFGLCKRLDPVFDEFASECRSEAA